MDNCPSKVLDILNKIKNEIDPSLAYRRSCAHGVCGSCAMNMDGKNGLACTKPHSEIKGDINIYPLPHLKVKKDLIGDLSGLYKQYQSIEPWLKTNTKVETTEILQSKKDREKFHNTMNSLAMCFSNMNVSLQFFHQVVHKSSDWTNFYLPIELDFRLANKPQLEHEDNDCELHIIFCNWNL